MPKSPIAQPNKHHLVLCALFSQLLLFFQKEVKFKSPYFLSFFFRINSLGFTEAAVQVATVIATAAIKIV